MSPSRDEQNERARVAGVLAAAADRVELGERLPSIPFLTGPGHIAICEFDCVLWGEFGQVVAALVSTYGDTTVSVIVLDPDVNLYLDNYQQEAAFEIAGDGIAQQYEQRMWHEPEGGSGGILGLGAEVVTLVGSSGAWGIFAQRDWELGCLFTRDRHGAWQDTGIPFFDPQVDFSGLRSPAGWGMPLSEDIVDEFRANVRAFEAG